ncbi:phosphotransferase [Shinella sp. S4-D37]|uniref:phosphotransferase n=1 Tax=Shinella sp. S4-D37 TaxID=3161999 RepID=UPI003464F1B7
MNAERTDDAFTNSWTPLDGSQQRSILADHFGLSGGVVRFNSERDETFLVTATDGAQYILKVANPQEDPTLLAFQTGAFLHLARVEPKLPVSRLIEARDGRVMPTIETAEGNRTARLFTYLAGEPLFKVASSAPQLEQLGRVCAMLGRGLSTYQADPPSDRILWDMAGFLELGARLFSYVDPARQALVRQCLGSFESDYLSVADTLARQPIHNDFNPYNILVDPDDANDVRGVIDFGDMVIGTVASDVGVALSYLVSRVGSVDELSHFLEAYCHIRPLSEPELTVLPVLMRARLAMTILITEWRAAIFPENRDYILRNHGNAVNALGDLNALSSSALRWTSKKS